MACSCASRAFQSRSQHYLSSKFTVSTFSTPNPSRNPRLRTLFEQSPHVCKDIRDLRFFLCPPERPITHVYEPMIVHIPGRTVVDENEPLLGTIQNLSEVKTLTIKLVKSHEFSQKWWLLRNFLPDPCSLVASIIRSSSAHIKKLCLYNISNFNSMFIVECFVVKDLVLEGSMLAVYCPPTNHSTSLLHVITSLMLGDGSQSIHSLVPCHLAHINSLEIHKGVVLSVLDKNLLPFSTCKIENLTIWLNRSRGTVFAIPLSYISNSVYFAINCRTYTRYAHYHTNKYPPSLLVDQPLHLQSSGFLWWQHSCMWRIWDGWL